MTIGVPIVTGLPRLYQQCNKSLPIVNKNLKVVPFESVGTVYYSPSIVTMAVSAAISQIFSVNEWPDLEI